MYKCIISHFRSLSRSLQPLLWERYHGDTYMSYVSASWVHDIGDTTAVVYIIQLVESSHVYGVAVENP